MAIRGKGTRTRRALDTAYNLTVGYGYRSARVLWLIAALLIIVTVTLQVPAALKTMRATTPAGTVYSTTGPLPGKRPRRAQMNAVTGKSAASTRSSMQSTP